MTATVPPLREAEFQRQVTDLATIFGWSWAHFRPAQTSRGWRTPVSGPLGAGFPDLVMVRRDRLIFAELKRDKAKVTDQQKYVLDVLDGVYAVGVYVWRPGDLDTIMEALR